MHFYIHLIPSNLIPECSCWVHGCMTQALPNSHKYRGVFPQGRTLFAGALVFHAACYLPNSQLWIIMSFLNTSVCQKQLWVTMKSDSCPVTFCTKRRITRCANKIRGVSVRWEAFVMTGWEWAWTSKYKRMAGKKLWQNESSFTKWLLPNENTMPGALSAIRETHTDSPYQPPLLWMNI